MYLLQWSENGSLRVYRFKLTPGQTIRKLPKWLWPAALLYWNVRTALLYLAHLVVGGPSYGFHEPQTDESLALGVKYAYRCEVEGDIAEFGTMSGTTAATIAKTMAEVQDGPGGGAYPPKKLHLFDSFKGLPKPESPVDKESPHVRSGVWQEGTCFVLSQDDLRGVCSKFLDEDRIVIHEGWFRDTLPKLEPGAKFSMLHIDCDLYESTVDVLDYCFSGALPQEGAAVFFDDWDDNRASPRFGERKAWSEAVEKFSIVCSEGREYGVAGKKFIVHSYKGMRREP